MALHKDFPDSPYATLDPDIRWFPADEALRETSMERTESQQVETNERIKQRLSEQGKLREGEADMRNILHFAQSIRSSVEAGCTRGEIIESHSRETEQSA